MAIQPFNLQKNLIINASGNLMCIDARQPFTIKINTIYGNGNNTFALPLTNNTTNLKIETSDGQSITITNYADSAKLIQFPSAGVYTLKIRGECGWSFNNTGDCQKVIGVSKWGRLKFNSFDGAFYGCVNIGLNEGLPVNGVINAPNVAYFYKSFSNCNITSINNTLLHLCVNAVDFQECFASNKITHIPSDFFKYATKTQSFKQCFGSNQLISIPIGLFDNCIKANSFYATFYNNLITSIPVGLFDSCVNVTTFYATFQSNPIASLPTGLFDYNTKVTNFQAVFRYTALATIPYRLFYNNKLVTDYKFVFANLTANCTVPTEIFDTSVLHIVTTFEYAMQQSPAKSMLGVMQDIWNYTSGTVLKTNCFIGDISLSNYESIPNGWKGL